MNKNKYMIIPAKLEIFFVIICNQIIHFDYIFWYKLFNFFLLYHFPAIINKYLDNHKYIVYFRILITKHI